MTAAEPAGKNIRPGGSAAQWRELDLAGQDRKTIIKDLIEQGKAKGKLTTKEINDALEELDYDVEQMDKLYDTLENNNIELVEDFIPDVSIEKGSGEDL